MLKHQYLLDKLILYFDLLILPHTHDALTHTHLCDIILAGWMVMGGWLCWVGGCGFDVVVGACGWSDVN